MNKQKDLEIRECFVSEKTNIVQSNYLIERKQKLSMPATQLLFTLTGMINKDDEDLKEYRVDVRYFADLWSVDAKLAYKIVADALDELASKGVRDHSVNPKTGNKVFTAVSFISFGRYEYGEGYAKIQIHPELRPHYIALKKEFTQFSLKNILQLQENGAQVNTLRTYELLKQYQKKGVRKISVTEYKEQLGLLFYDKKGNVIKEKYKGSNTNLKLYVLDPAKEKINEYTDIKIDYEITGRGSKAIINFTIKKNPACAEYSANQISSNATLEKEKTEPHAPSQNVSNEPKKTKISQEALELLKKALLEFDLSDVPKETIDEIRKELHMRLDKVEEPSELFEDYSQNPLERSFRNEDEKRAYIEGYLETHFTDEVCKDYLVDVIPEDVHGYEEAKVEAIKSVAMEYITFEQTSENANMDRMMQWHTNLRKAVQAYTKQKWLPNHCHKVQTDAFEYFKSCLGYWLMDNVEQ